MRGVLQILNGIHLPNNRPFSCDCIHELIHFLSFSIGGIAVPEHLIASLVV